MIKKIATHARPDGDELLALWMLRNFAEKTESLYPGASTAKMVNFTMDMLPPGVDPDTFPCDMLFVGCGKGELDEHHRKSPNQCAATRVAFKLGVRRERSLEWLLVDTLECDRSRAKAPNSLYDAIKLVSTCFLDEPERAYDWAMVAYNAIYAHEKNSPTDNIKPIDMNLAMKFITENLGAPAAVSWMEVYRQATTWREGQKNKARHIWDGTSISELYLPDGRAVKLAVVRSDNDQVNFIGWSERQIGVLIQVNSSGNVQIYTLQRMKISLKPVAELIRRREMELRGDTNIPHPNVLRATDTVAEVPYWHMPNFANQPILFNGNQLTAPGVDPTKIPVAEIVELVVKGLKLSEERVLSGQQFFSQGQPHYVTEKK